MFQFVAFIAGRYFPFAFYQHSSSRRLTRSSHWRGTCNVCNVGMCVSSVFLCVYIRLPQTLIPHANVYSSAVFFAQSKSSFRRPGFRPWPSHPAEKGFTKIRRRLRTIGLRRIDVRGSFWSQFGAQELESPAVLRRCCVPRYERPDASVHMSHLHVVALAHGRSPIHLLTLADDLALT